MAPPDRRAILNGVAQEFRAPPALESGEPEKDQRELPCGKTQGAQLSVSRYDIFSLPSKEVLTPQGVIGVSPFLLT